MDNDKYAVFKYEDYEDFLKSFTHGPQNRLDDAIVIRPQDVFAGPGLSAYAAAIQTWIDLIVLEGGDTQFPHMQYLEELRDFFFEQAQLAFSHPNKKVPD